MTPTAPATTSAQALQNLQSFQGSEKSPTDLLQSQEQSLGVPQAQQQVSGLRSAIQNTTNLLNQVAPSVYGNTQNSLVTDAQANQQIQNRQAPLNSQLNTEGTQYTNAESDANNAQSQADTLAQLEATGQSGQEAYLQQIYQNLYGQESDAANRAEDLQKANISASSSGNSLSPSLASIQGSSGGGQPNASYGFKVANSPGSGYYFRDANGNPISALQYAQATGADYKGLIQKMADSGDAGAQQYLKLGAPTTLPGSPYSTQTLALIKDFIGWITTL